MSDMLEAATIDIAAVAPSLSFPVVGIGASAGGLPALIRLVENMPANNGMAFVVVTQRVTRMPVLQVMETVKIEPNHVYVIAPASS
jgi:two-component system CheB/CheR fusion protein